jgi:mycothiol maleylpyruvate isomerase-like protein
MTSEADLLREEDQAWAELRAVTDPLTPQQLSEDGYYEDWSGKDLLAHLGSWLAEAATILEQIRMGTHAGWDEDEDEINRRWWEAWREEDLSAVKAHLHSGRGRMLQEWELLSPDLVTDKAVEWFRDSGVLHYREHLPRLQEWAAGFAGP